MVHELDARRPDFEAALQRFLARTREAAVDVDGVVAEILAEVAARGDDALLAYTRRFDRLVLSLDTLRVGADRELRRRLRMTAA